MKWKKTLLDTESIIEAVKIIRPKKGDAIVLKYPGRLSLEALENLKETFKKGALAKLGLLDTPIIILEEGLDIEILRKED